MEALALPTSLTDYADKVITYHQYKDALGLTAAEARTHEDTLEAFGDVFQSVQSDPELAAAYTGVLRCRGDNKAAAIEKVRAIEKDISASLHDLDVVDEQTYLKERAALAEDAEVRLRAERFVRLFRKAIPPSQLPKSKRKSKQRKIHTDRETADTVAESVPQGQTIANDEAPIAHIEGFRHGQAPALGAMLKYVNEKGIENAQGRVIAPTGSGKTFLMAKFLECLREDDRLPVTVIVVPTLHLKQQTYEELRARGFNGRIQLHESRRPQDPRANVIIITQAGFARQLNQSGRSIDAERVGLVMFDEAHHIGGEKTKEAIKAKLPHAGIIGLTASPDYDERRKLAHHLPDLIHEITNDEGVEWSLVSPYQTILLPTHGDLSYAVPTGKDYHQYMLDKAVNTSARNHLVARFLVDNFMDELVMANVNTVKHAEVFAETMRQYGKATLAISGATRNIEAVFDAFRNREITGIVQVKVAGEGVDLVPLEVVANVLPTLSEVRQKQRVGRGQRIDTTNPDKVLKVVECIDDLYARKPVLYGTLTGHWLYGGGKEIAPFVPAAGYNVLQTPDEIDAWWNGEITLPRSGGEDFEKREGTYTPVEAKVFPDKPTVIDLGEARRQRTTTRKKMISLEDRHFHEARKRSKKQEFDEAFDEDNCFDPTEEARSQGGGAADYILDGASHSAALSLRNMKHALRTLAGNPSLKDEAVLERYKYIQDLVKQTARDPSPSLPARVAAQYLRNLATNKPAWHANAACVDTPSVSFYPGRGQDTRAAKEVCSDCEARDDCLQDALSRGDKFGVWGGLSERQRRLIRRVTKSGEATPAEVKVLIATMRDDVEPEEEDALDEFDDVFESANELTA